MLVVGMGVIYSDLKYGMCVKGLGLGHVRFGIRVCVGD